MFPCYSRGGGAWGRGGWGLQRTTSSRRSAGTALSGAACGAPPSSSSRATRRARCAVESLSPAPAPAGVARAERRIQDAVDLDATCPLSTGRRTRRVQLVQEGGEGGGGGGGASRTPSTCASRFFPHGVRDAACPISTRGGTRLVRLVRGREGGGGGTDGTALQTGPLYRRGRAGRVAWRNGPLWTQSESFQRGPGRHLNKHRVDGGVVGVWRRGAARGCLAE